MLGSRTAATSESPYAPEAIAAACLFSLAIIMTVAMAAALAVAGTALLLIPFGDRGNALRRVLSELRLTAALVAVALAAILAPSPLIGAPPVWIAGAVPAVVIPLALADLIGRWVRRHPIIAGTAILLVGLSAGLSIVRATRGAGIDVVLLHRAAAAALMRGLNPYGAAVSVLNGAPGAAPGSLIVGYPYPPIAAAAYAAATWLAGDPRWASLASWALLIVCAVALSRQRENPTSAWPLLLIAAIPGWALMLQSGWTEALSAALVALAAASWKRPVASGIALGAALASKQYFIVLLPVLLLWRGAQWRRRTIVAAITASLLIAPAFASSPADGWRALVLFHASTGLRADSSNLVGVLALLGVRWSPPVWLALGVSFAVAGVLARRAAAPAGFWRAAAAALAVFFLLSRQALSNYWYLVAVITVFASQPTGETRRPPSAAALLLDGAGGAGR